MRLTDTDRQHLLAAQGWLELGALEDSFAELDRIQPEHHAHPDVLRVRWGAYQSAGMWAQAIEIARELVKAAPDQFDGYWMRSFALHETGRTQEAYDTLVAVRARFNREHLLHYNLGCYLAQLGRLDESRTSLKAAFVLNSEMRATAAHDKDLKPLWPELNTRL